MLKPSLGLSVGLAVAAEEVVALCKTTTELSDDVALRCNGERSSAQLSELAFGRPSVSLF